jgi:hypothetical protein
MFHTDLVIGRCREFLLFGNQGRPTNRELPRPGAKVTVREQDGGWGKEGGVRGRGKGMCANVMMTNSQTERTYFF